MKIIFSKFDSLRIPEVAKNMLFLQQFLRFTALSRNHFARGCKWLTTAGHNKKWLIKNKI